MKPLEDAALFRCYPQDWQVWESGVEDDAPYVLKAEVPTKPVGDELDRLLYGEPSGGGEAVPGQPAPRKAGFFTELQRFFNALSQ
jgi:hypothetical protein